MSYQATVFNLMLSCPSDTEKEQGTIITCINRWNDINSEKHSIVLLPVFYKTQVPAELATQEDERTQAVINKYMGENCDWLIAVFRNRFGTPTGKAKSGTIEEIDLFKKNNPERPISVYFFRDCKNEKIMKYKGQLKGIWKEYERCEDLEREFYDNLSQIVYKNSYFKQLLLHKKDQTVIRANLLLSELASDIKQIMIAKRILGQETKIETNGNNFFGYGDAVKYLLDRNMIKKHESERDLFILTEFGQQRIDSLG